MPGSDLREGQCNNRRNICDDMIIAQTHFTARQRRTEDSALSVQLACAVHSLAEYSVLSGYQQRTRCVCNGIIISEFLRHERVRVFATVFTSIFAASSLLTGAAKIPGSWSGATGASRPRSFKLKQL